MKALIKSWQRVLKSNPRDWSKKHNGQDVFAYAERLQKRTRTALDKNRAEYSKLYNLLLEWEERGL